jgi:hypothetical protein
MPDRGMLQRFLEKLLPWYDADQATRLHQRTVAIAQRSSAARILAYNTRRQVMRDSFDQAQRRLQGR